MATNIGYISNANGTNFVTVTNGEFLRRADATWNKVRLGVRMSFREYRSSEQGASTPSTLFGTPRIYVGLCNYDRGGVASKNSAMHFVGMRSSSTSWTRSSNGGAGANIPFYNSTFQAVRREANTFTAGTNIGFSSTLPIFGASNYFMLSVDIDKTNPATTVTSLFAPTNSGTGIYNVTQSQFLTAMEAAVPSLTGYTYSTTAPFVLNEATNGILDAINIYWSRSRCVLNLTDVWYSIIA
jgi:hypothetical protein